MQRLGWLAILMLVPMAVGVEPYVVLLDWTEGYSPVGTTTLVASPLAPAFPIAVGDCHRFLLADLLYDPSESGVDVDGLGEFSLAYEFLVDVLQGATLVSRTRVTHSGYGAWLGEVAPGGYDVRVSLANGANVSWSLRVRGQADQLDPACLPPVFVNEVEANPAGADAGFEWVEIHNADSDVVDLSGWTLVATHGTPASLTLPAGTSIAAGGYLKVGFPSQFLDNTDELVELRDDLNGLRDATPTLSDTANNSSTWQRSPDGSSAWSFAPGTPDAANG